MKRTARAGFSLVEVILVVVIIAILAAVIVPRLTGGGKDVAGRRVAGPRQRAEQTAGVSYTQQIGMALQMYRDDNEGRNPPDLAALKAYGITDEMLVDPVSKQPLAYDPVTGRVGGTTLPGTPGF